MGKAMKVKTEMMEVLELVDLIEVLKDVADNKYYSLIAQKDRLVRFAESFVEFFRMVSFSTVRHPLISNEDPRTGILVISSDGSFMGELNTKIVRAALDQKEEYKESVFIAVGRKGAERLIPTFGEMKVFEEIENEGFYESSVKIKTHLVEEVMAGRIGKVVAVYPWAKDINTVNARTIKLLPCEELVLKQAELIDPIKDLIEESDSVDMTGYLAELWLSSKLYEMLYDASIAAAAAQATRLDNSRDKMRKEKKISQLKYRKAKRSDIDNSLRETFSAKMVAGK